MKSSYHLYLMRLRIAKKQYAKINPLGLTITLRFTRENYKDAEMWNHIVVGKYNQIISDSKYRLDQADSPMNYGEYSKIYEQWGEKIIPSSLSSLAKSLKVN